MKIVSVIPVKGREELLFYTVKRLTRQKVIVICVGHTKSEEQTVINAGGIFEYCDSLFTLGQKWQFGIEIARKHKPDAILIMGSSDWVSENWCTELYKDIEAGAAMTGIEKIYFLDIAKYNQKRMILWGGYRNERKGESIGTGRMISAKAMDLMNWQIFDKMKNDGMDYSITRAIARIRWTGPKVCLNRSDIYALSISTYKWINKHSFNEESILPNVTEIADPDTLLKDHFSEALNLFGEKEPKEMTRVDQMYISGSVSDFSEKLKSKYKLKDLYDPSKPVMIFGLYSQEVYDFAISHKPHKIIVWAGSDSMKIHPKVRLIKNVSHIAISSFISDDLSSAGIPHKLLPITPTHLDLKACPRGNNIYWYYSQGTSNFYGEQFAGEVAKRTGLNIIKAHYQSFSREDLIEVYKSCFIGVRMTKHDGLPNTAVELGLMGRNIIHNGDIPNSIPYTDLDDVVRIIMEEYEKRHKDNTGISRIVRDYLNISDDWLYVPKETPKFSIVIPTLWMSNKIMTMLPIYEAEPLVDEVLIIDNNPRKRPKFHCKKVRILTKNTNIFVNPAWNWGVAEARNENVVIANDDVIIRNLNHLLLKAMESDFDLIGVDHKGTRKDDSEIQLTEVNEMAWGYGCYMILLKSRWVKIPDQFKIWYGDTIQFWNANKRGAFSGIYVNTKMNETIDRGFRKMAEKEIPLFKEYKKKERKLQMAAI